MNLHDKKSVHIHLCEKVLLLWNSHFPLGNSFTYQETVAGTIQTLDIDLPKDALASVRAGHDIANVEMRYVEPIVAMQDCDLELPDSIEMAYYSIHNCFKLHILGATVDDWIIVNQALSALGDDDTIANLQEAVQWQA
ncbi:MAG: hypothetical protein Q8O00_06135 [Holophaga sp.]|nr:hypothetical protein [Holophaga sp.]